MRKIKVSDIRKMMELDGSEHDAEWHLTIRVGILSLEAFPNLITHLLVEIHSRTHHPVEVWWHQGSKGYRSGQSVSFGKCQIYTLTIHHFTDIIYPD
jgi:hypothetical protein